MVALTTLVESIDSLLDVARFKDYAPNGLQVEGKSDVQRIVSGVTASKALIDAAIEAKADAILVHHGWFWRGEDQRIVGMKRYRIKALLDHDISLLGYHLPLDAHPELGNNAQLAKQLGFISEGVMNAEGVGNYGHLEKPMTASELSAYMQQRLNRTPTVVTAGDHPIKTIAWCTGGAQSYIQQAIALGVDAYVSGEISEQTTHEARENGIHYFAAGHHATERYGAPALGEYLAQQFGIEHQFIDIDNPA
ncbi:Nif3-like dinuclear metal center hexameric protein [Leucothrix pacifica]|uniref:GTP cyclohydrolase 1 type 2 homolog n=1 Tax=Leucothrix pacifica TaxID=1247513 RepID=A0A317C8K8_9GAMM|nr:Nif3-like dinuclear metal center hexameric protein [Leucothrix pacifica]PWQ94828.1 Nif3-like dinuclear metal center hexameric protein [Leucothrix pacifica]